jgi:ADP-ribosylglycohydrolase
VAPTLRERFRACLLGAALGDVAGAPVEAESPAYIAATYRSVDDILAQEAVAEFTGLPWRVGRFTDDTQMTLCVAEWLLAGESHSPELLLARLAAAHEPWRRYGPSTESILRLYPHYKAHWRELATASFPHGSYGNGGVARVAPIGLAFHSDPAHAACLAVESSRPTHAHPLACQGAALHAVAVATAVSQTEFDATEYLRGARATLTYFADLLQDTAPYTRALDAIEQGLARNAPCCELAETLGTGIAAYEAFPGALSCSLRHPGGFEDVLHDAIFIGGDTDTIASMSASLSGALLGLPAVPSHWLAAIREENHSPAVIASLADQLFDTFARPPRAARDGRG